MSSEFDTEIRGEYSTKTLKIDGFVAWEFPDDRDSGSKKDIIRWAFVTNAEINIDSETLDSFVVDDGKPVAGRTTDEIGKFKIDFKHSIEWWPTRDISSVAETALTNDERLTLAYWQRKIAEGDWPEIKFIQAFTAPWHKQQDNGEIRNKARSGYDFRIKSVSQVREEGVATEDGVVTGTITGLNDSIRDNEFPFPSR